jgi:hypothetical protein
LRTPGPLFLAAALALGACAQARDSGTAAPAGASAPPPAPAQAARTQPARTAPEPPAPRLGIADILGIDAGRLDSLLGAPELVRRDGSGEVRLYRAPDCVLHVFVYPRDGGARATHIEARGSNGRMDTAATEACVARFG